MLFALAWFFFSVSIRIASSSRHTYVVHSKRRKEKEKRLCTHTYTRTHTYSHTYTHTHTTHHTTRTCTYTTIYTDTTHNTRVHNTQYITLHARTHTTHHTAHIHTQHITLHAHTHTTNITRHAHVHIPHRVVSERYRTCERPDDLRHLLAHHVVTHKPKPLLRTLYLHCARAP